MEDQVFSSAPEMMIPTCSVASEITGDDVLVSDFVEQEESSVMEKESSKWTNEKHSSYLRSIEASFVDQLYNSLDMLSCQTQNTCYSLDAISTWKNHPNKSIPSGQFKVLHRGCWSKKSLKKQNSHLKSHVSPGNPWIQHFRNGSLKRPCSTATSLRYHVPDSQLEHEPDCSNIEVTDQNFQDDTSCGRKSARTSKISNSSNDQVVPHFNSAATEIPNSYVSLKSKDSISFPCK